MTSRVVAYLRVSTARQSQSGLGLDGQREAIASFCRLHEAIVVREYEEVESGRNSGRPVLEKALAHARRLKATLLVARLDRLSRSVAFIASVLDADVDFAVANNPSANRLLLHVLSAVAEDEARAISERTKAALKAAKARGVKLGASDPRSRNLSEAAMKMARKNGPAANRQRAIKEFSDLLPIMQEWRLQGQSLRKIAANLNKDGVPTRRGAEWNAVQVKRVLDRERDK